MKMIPRNIYNLLKLPGLRYNLENSIRFYSVFPPHYVKPVFKKDEQKPLYTTNKIVISDSFVKPATTSDTCSEFHDNIARKFTNYIMRKGKKELARKLLEKTFENIKIIQLEKYYNTPSEYRDQIILDPIKILHLAVENCTPILELQLVSRGGISYQVPVPVSVQRAKFLSMNWLIQTANDKGDAEKLSDVLAKELLDAAENKGRVINKKHELHKKCEANRAYAHYRWL